MQFSDTTNKNGILQTCELLLDLGDGGITGNIILRQQFTNLINNDAYDEVVAEILKNEGSWVWDDFKEGNSLLPVGYQTLSVAAGSEVATYALPTAASGSGLGNSDASSFLRLITVQVKDAAGYFQNILPIDDNAYNQPLETIFYNPAFPKWYKQIGTSITLLPAPLASQVTAVNGLKITFQRDKVDFLTTTGSDTQMPGFPSIYHYLLALITSETYAAIKGMKQLNFLTQKKLKFYQNLGWGVANRNKQLPQRITSATARRNPNYE
jgi:hypothetical protein